MTAILSAIFQTNPFITEPLTSGEAVLMRAIASGSSQLTTGDLVLSYFKAQKTESCLHVRTTTSGNASTTPTYSAAGIYSVAANGNLTLLAQTGDVHASTWTSTFTEYNSLLTTAFAKQAGTQYALGVLTVDAGGSCGLTGASATSLYFSQAPPMTGVLTGQATLPASITAGSLVGGPPFGLIVQAVIAP